MTGTAEIFANDQTTTEKAPDAGQGVEGQIPEGTEMNTTIAEPTDTAQERRLLKWDSATYSEDELSFAHNEGLSRMETRYVLTTDTRCENLTYPDGKVFRDAGWIYIRTCLDGVRRFVVYTYKKADQHDFKYFDRAIRDAMNGRMDGWRRYTFKNGEQGWVFEYGYYRIDNIKEFKPARVIIEQKAEAKSLIGFGSDWGYKCEEPQCREKYHGWQDISHTHDALDKQLTERSSYGIEICKGIADPGAQWYVDIFTSPDFCELTPEQVSAFANDLNWMAIECATTNAKEAAA